MVGPTRRVPVGRLFFWGGGGGRILFGLRRGGCVAQRVDKLRDLVSFFLGLLRFLFGNLQVKSNFFFGFLSFAGVAVGLREPEMRFIRKHGVRNGVLIFRNSFVRIRRGLRRRCLAADTPRRT